VSSSESRTERHLRIGALKRPHGLRGEIAVLPVGNFPEQIRKGARVAAVESPGRPSRAGAEVLLEIESARPNGTHVLVKFTGRDSIDAVSPLSGMDLTIDRAVLERPGEDFLFDDEVRGFACVSPSGEALGRADGFERHGPACCLVVARGEDRFLVPYVRPIVRDVSRTRREIVLDAPEGLFEVPGSGR
jgi:16S rRNA processing protein RimM